MHPRDKMLREMQRPEYVLYPPSHFETRRSEYDTHGGPLNGRKLTLWSGSTLRIRLHGRRGRYVATRQPGLEPTDNTYWMNVRRSGVLSWVDR